MRTSGKVEEILMHDRKLPAQPDLRQYRKQAKELVKAANSTEALARIRRHLPRWQQSSGPDPPSFKLADAQLVIAREHGFVTWPQFAKHVEAAHAEKSSAAQHTDAVAKPSLWSIAVAGAELDAELGLVVQPRGLVVMAHASGSSRYRPAFRHVARAFNQAHWATLSVDLMTDDEELNNDGIESDFRLLGNRLMAVTDWIARQPLFGTLPLGYWAAGMGAAAMVFAAGERAAVVGALVSSGGRPDLAGSSFWRSLAPTLLIAGGADSVGVGFNRFSASIFPPHNTCSFKIVAGATQRLDTPEAQGQAIALACDWFHQYLLPRKEG